MCRSSNYLLLAEVGRPLAGLGQLAPAEGLFASLTRLFASLTKLLTICTGLLTPFAQNSATLVQVKESIFQLLLIALTLSSLFLTFFAKKSFYYCPFLIVFIL